MVNNIVFQIIYAKLNIAPLEACMRYGLNGSNPLWRLYWLLGSAIFSWQNKFHSLADQRRRMGIVCAIRKAQIEPGMLDVCSL